MRDLLRVFQLAVDSMGDAMVAVDDGGRVVICNEAAESLFGARLEGMRLVDLEARLLPALWHGGEPGELPLARAARGDDILAEECVLAGDLEHRVRLTARPLKHGRRGGTILVFRQACGVETAEWALREAEEMRRARDAAEAANRAKSAFLASMSHEIRTPLHGVLGMADLVLATSLTPEQREYLQILKSSADSLMAIINDILDFSKVEAGRMALESVSFGLRDTLGDCLASLAVKAHEKMLEMSLHVEANVPDLVVGDPARLRQVLLNLVGNSIKFTERGEVAVEVRVEDRADGDVLLRFSVSDTGIGIPQEKCCAIFDRFSQADPSTARRFGGTGLGLAISARLVGLMGGRIWVESEVGRGSVFHFSMPLHVEAGPEEGLEARASLLHDLPILVVDHHVRSRSILDEMMQGWGLRPVTADCGATALAHLEEAHRHGMPFSVAVVDAALPLTADEPWAEVFVRKSPGTSVILLSTSRVSEPRPAFVGASVIKPVRPAELLYALHRVLGVLPLGEEHQGPTCTPSPRRLRVLLAEDHPVNRLLAVRLLERRGHDVEVAETGAAAVAAVRAGRYDAVLMDVHMPDMDGYEATAEIRRAEQGTGLHTPIYALTAAVMKEDRDRCFAVGMDAFIPKPIHPDDLFATLEGPVGGPAPAPAESPAPAPPPPARAVRGPVDHRSVFTSLGGEPDLLRMVVERLRASCPGYVEEIRACITRGDGAGLARQAHSLKGLLMSLSARPAAHMADELEHLGPSGCGPAALDLCDRLEAEMVLVVTALEQLCC